MGLPSKLFTSPYTTIAGKGRLVTFKNAFVTQIDITGPNLPAWPFLQGATSVQAISEETFLQRFNVQEYAAARKRAWTSENIPQLGFTEIFTVDGRRLIWEVQQQSRQMHTVDLLPLINSFFSTGGLHATMPNGGGYMIVNPANIATIAFYPGPPEAPFKAWRAESI